MKEQFKFKLIDSFPGYNSASDKTKLSEGHLIRGSKNVYKNLRGNIAVRPGIKRRGEVDDTDAGVKAEYVWNTNVGTVRPLRVCNNKLQVESNIVDENVYVWYDLLETSTLAHPAVTLTRFIFDTWWDDAEKTDRLIMARGSLDTILHWSGGMALVDSATVDTITKQGTEIWAEVGFATQIAGEKKILIDGTEYTYTGGENTTTLTGVTPSPIAETSGDVVIQSIIVGSTDTTGFEIDFIKTDNNQVWAGSYSSRIVYKSADITAGGVLGFLNYIDTTDIVFGDPDSVVLDATCKGIGVKDGKIILFAGDSYMYVITPNQNVTFSYDYGPGTRYNFQKIEKKQLPGLNSALGHEFIDNFGEYLVWLDQKNQLRALGSFSSIDNIKPTTLSLDVQAELSEDDFTGGHLRAIEDAIYITAPNNGRDWMYVIRERVDDEGQVISEKFWNSPQIRGISRFSVIEGMIYGHSNVNPQIYQIWDTDQWIDDSPNGSDNEEIPYIPVARLSYQNHDVGPDRIVFDIAYFEGYMPEGFDLRGTIYFDYRGATGIRNLIISDDVSLTKFFTGDNAPTIGDSSPGDNPLGDGILDEVGEQDLVPKFRAMSNVPIIKNSYEYSLEIYSVDPDCRWELSVVGTNARLASEGNALLRKSTL